MNWIDNAIAFISPKKAAEREAWRQYTEEIKRNYDSGSYERLNANWRAINDSAEIIDRNYRDTIRARARDLERNSDMMGAVISAWKRNVIGGGYTLQAKAEDADISRILEDAWKKWCKKQNCDITGTQSLNQMLRMFITRKKVDGGILIKKCYTGGGFLPLKLQIFEVDELDITQTDPYTKGNKVIGGIEINKYNKPVGFWIRQYDPEGYSLLKPVYIDAKDMIYYFSKSRPSQIREISDMTTTIPRIRDANEFMTAVSVKERIAACLAVLIKRLSPTTPGRTNGNEKTTYSGKTLSPGLILEMNSGDEASVVNPPSSSSDATGHIKLLQRMTGAGQGLSYEATARDMSETNYSSARQAGIEDGLTYIEEKELIIELLDEIYETFVISCALAGIIDTQKFWNAKDQYLEHKWIQAAKPWIDPVKEANANKTALMTGQKTFMQIAAEGGRDWQEQIDDMVNVIEYGRKKGIELGGVIFGQDYLQTTKTDGKG